MRGCDFASAHFGPRLATTPWALATQTKNGQTLRGRLRDRLLPPSGGNAWSSYWYDGFIYANDINRGLDIFAFSDKARAGARKLRTLNPQTQLSLIR
jgi:hypothetical protein